MEQVPSPALALEFFHHVTSAISSIFTRLFRMDTMASPVDSMAPLDYGRRNIRRMVHLKTKEECRLGNETIQVWTVELPSRHAEGILRYCHFIPLTR
jgi:tRNA-specific adenosine deaminase 3